MSPANSVISSIFLWEWIFVDHFDSILEFPHVSGALEAAQVFHI